MARSAPVSPRASSAGSEPLRQPQGRRLGGSLAAPAGHPCVDCWRRARRFIRAVWACRAQRGQGAPATVGTRRLCRPTRPRSAAERGERSDVFRARVARFSYALFFSAFCSTSGALAEDWNAGVSGEIVGTYRSGLWVILRGARVRSGAVSPGLGPLMLFALIGARGTAVRMRFRSLARYERRTLPPSVRMLALVGLLTAYGSAIPCR